MEFAKTPESGIEWSNRKKKLSKESTKAGIELELRWGVTRWIQEIKIIKNNYRKIKNAVDQKCTNGVESHYNWSGARSLSRTNAEHGVPTKDGVPGIGEDGVPGMSDDGATRMGKDGVPGVGEDGDPAMGEDGVPDIITVLRPRGAGTGVSERQPSGWLLAVLGHGAETWSQLPARQFTLTIVKRTFVGMLEFIWAVMVWETSYVVEYSVLK